MMSDNYFSVQWVCVLILWLSSIPNGQAQRGNWTWIKENEFPGATAVHGMQGIPDAANLYFHTILIKC